MEEFIGCRLDDTTIHNMFQNSYVIEYNGMVIAAAQLVVIDKANEKVGQVYSVCVAKEYQGKGFGRILMDYVAEQAKEKGCDYLKLECSHSKMGFYKKLGFELSSQSMRKTL